MGRAFEGLDEALGMIDVAELITRMIKEGVSAEICGQVAAALAERGVPIDVQAQRRREFDRQRKQESRNTRPRNSAESADKVSPSSFPSDGSPSFPPYPPYNPSLPPQPSSPSKGDGGSVGEKEKKEARQGEILEIEEAVSAWNELAGELNLPVCQKLTVRRRAALKARLRDCGGIQGWGAVLQKIRETPFFRGVNDRGWKADFDFVLREEKFTKLMEGGYANTGKNVEINGFQGGHGGSAGGSGKRPSAYDIQAAAFARAARAEPLG
jgi:hypothetical protein